MADCPTCDAHKEHIASLKERIRFLESSMNPQAAQPGVMPEMLRDAKGRPVDYLDKDGQGWVNTPDGPRPVEEAERVQRKLEEMMGGPR